MVTSYQPVPVLLEARRVEWSKVAMAEKVDLADHLAASDRGADQLSADISSPPDISGPLII